MHINTVQVVIYLKVVAAWGSRQLKKPGWKFDHVNEWLEPKSWKWSETTCRIT